MARKIIWIAEDDPDDRLMMVEAFRENILEDTIRFFENGEDLYSSLHNQQGGDFPAVILLDLNMPKMDGKAFLKRIQKDAHFQTIPVVVLTTSKSEEEKKAILSLGAKAFYTKPSSFNDLVNITCAILNTWIH